MAELFGKLRAGEPRFHPVAVPLQGSADQLAEFYIVIHCQNICHKITSKRYKARQDAPYSRYTWAG